MIKIPPALAQAESKGRARRPRTPGTPNAMTLEELLALPAAVDLVTAGPAWASA